MITSNPSYQHSLDLSPLLPLCSMIWCLQLAAQDPGAMKGPIRAGCQQQVKIRTTCCLSKAQTSQGTKENSMCGCHCSCTGTPEKGIGVLVWTTRIPQRPPLFFSGGRHSFWPLNSQTAAILLNFFLPVLFTIDFPFPICTKLAF